MIFYFSGTGNSLYTAKQLGSGQELVNITDCVQQERFSFQLKPDETLGLVCPILYGGLPALVLRFLENLRLEGTPAYTFVVKVGDFEHFEEKDYISDQLRERKFFPDAVFSLSMPGNCVLLYEIEGEEKESEILAAAEEGIRAIRADILGRRISEKNISGSLRGVENSSEYKAGMDSSNDLSEKERDFLLRTYDRERSTSNFHMLDTCIGCGTCMRRCPERAIEMKDGLPVWIKDTCSLCLACMRCGAIVHGSKSEGRRRYTHPALRKKKAHAHKPAEAPKSSDGSCCH